MINRRSVINYSINRHMQLRLLVRVMLIVLINTAILSAFFYIYSNQEIGQSFRHFHIQARNFLDFLLPAIVIALIIGIIVAFIIALFFPHKIAGPLYRMEREIKEKVSEGNLTVRFSVRKGDEVGELAEALNIMIAKLKLKLGKIKTASDELAVCSNNVNKGDEHLKKILDAQKRLEEAVKEFQL
ncbi:MAG: HAMP domain-containing protein [Deltaproteobacteria bacterium]